MPKGIGGGGAGGGPGAGDANASASANAGSASGGKGDKGKKGKGPKKSDKKPCRPKKVSEAKYKKLRDKTPSQDLRDSFANVKHCWACGQTSSKPMSPDHVVPMKQITEMKGFSCLSEEKQVAILNGPDPNKPTNFRPLCFNCNTSKQEKKWKDWTGHSDPNRPLRPGIKGAAVQLSSKLEKSIGGTIGALRR